MSISEGGTLRHVIRVLERIERQYPGANVEGTLDLVRKLERQVASGVHRNPPIVFYGNPPLRSRRSASRTMGRFEWGEKMSDDVHQLRYTHVEDGKDYEHDFGGGVEMWAIERAGQRNILLTDRDGKPLWGDF